MWLHVPEEPYDGQGDEITILSLCAGVGMLDEGLALGIEHACGRRARVVCYVERDAYAAAALVARMEEASLAPAPVWDDLTTFPGRDWRGCVDFVCAGIPCQGNSMAGNRRLEDDPRNLWPAARRLLRDVGPFGFFLENVPGFLVPDARAGRSAPAARLLGELGEDGFDAEWGTLSAAAVGAGHLRERFWCLAYAREQRWGAGGPAESFGVCHMLATVCTREHEPRAQPEGRAVAGGAGGDVDHASSPRRDATGCWQQAESEGGQRMLGDGCCSLADAASPRCEERGHATERELPTKAGDGLHDRSQQSGYELAEPALRGRGELREPSRGDGQPDGGGEPLADAECSGPQGHRSSEPESCGGDGRIFAPGPGDLDAWKTVLAGQPWLAPAVEPGVCVLADGVALVVDESRADQLRCAGNGVVALTAACAFVELDRRLRT